MDQNNMQQPVQEPVQQPAQASSKGKSIAAMVCGIIGVAGCFIPGGWVFVVITLVLAIIGIVLGSQGMKAAKATGEGKGMAVAGLVLGIIGTVMSGIGLICAVACATAISAAGSSLGDLSGLGF